MQADGVTPSFAISKAALLTGRTARLMKSAFNERRLAVTTDRLCPNPHVLVVRIEPYQHVAFPTLDGAQSNRETVPLLLIPESRKSSPVFVGLVSRLSFSNDSLTP